MQHIDAVTLASVIDAWERHASALDDAPYEMFRAAHRREARYLWMLSRSLGPPRDVDRQPIRNLLDWGLVAEDASVTPLGRRLLATAKPQLAPDPFGSMRTKGE